MQTYRWSMVLAPLTLAGLSAVAGCRGQDANTPNDYDLTPGIPATGGEAPGAPGGWPPEGTTEEPGALPGGDHPGKPGLPDPPPAGE